MIGKSIQPKTRYLRSPRQPITSGVLYGKYKVLLVDDEAEVIEVIEQRIQWDDLGFTVVGNATNGVKALELVEKLQPDVVITDIKMPYMDGLELSRRLNRDFQNIHIIILQGLMSLNMQRKQCIWRLRNIC